MGQFDAIHAQNTFSLTHPEFYETLSRHSLSPEYLNRLEHLLPRSWTLRRSDVWIHAQQPAEGRASAEPVMQGFKIHVSATLESALPLLDIVVPVCVDQKIDFKIKGDPALLRMSNSKIEHRGYSGKFMTLYPADERELVDAIETLYLRTKDARVSGPYILSDKRYKDSRVLYYRFGGFRPPQRLNVDGTRTDLLVSPSGEQVPDQRLPYFHLPEWVRDPFADQPPPDQGSAKDMGPRDHAEPRAHLAREEEDAEDAVPPTVLRDRYRIEGAYGFTNAGGVYRGEDLSTGRPVVIKEARPLTNFWSVGERAWDAADLLQREYEMLCRLRGLGIAPEPVEFFEAWEHSFLAEERIDGIVLNTYMATEDLILAPYIRRQGSVERFIPIFKHIATGLISMVTAVHDRGVLLGDVSPRNILINGDSLRMHLIDFESSALADDEPEVMAYANMWGTPGFTNPARSSRSRLLPRDDLYAVAMILYSCVVPINYFFILNPAAQRIFLDELIALGVPVEVKAVIDSLLDGCANQAREILDAWRVPPPVIGGSNEPPSS
jgi:hypothetical protein